MRVVGARVDLQLLVDLATERPLGQHAPHRALDQLGGVTLDQLLGRVLLQTAREERVMAIDLVRPLLARQANLLSVDHNDEVARVGVRGKHGLVLSAQNRGDLGTGTAQGLALDVGDVPRAHEGIVGGNSLTLARRCCRHGALLILRPGGKVNPVRRGWLDFSRSSPACQGSHSKSTRPISRMRASASELMCSSTCGWVMMISVKSARGRQRTKHLQSVSTEAVAGWFVMSEISPNASPDSRWATMFPPVTALASPASSTKSPGDLPPSSRMRRPSSISRKWKRADKPRRSRGVKGAKSGLVSASLATRRSRRKRNSTLSNSGDPASRSPSSARSMARTWLSTVARAVALRGRSASSAISPKKSPSDSRAISCGASTAISPHATTYSASPGSPCANRISPAASWIRCTRSTAMWKNGRERTEKNGVLGNTNRAMVLRPAPLCGWVDATAGAKSSSMGISMAPLLPVAGTCSDWRDPGIRAARRSWRIGGGTGAASTAGGIVGAGGGGTPAGKPDGGAGVRLGNWMPGSVGLPWAA